MANILLQQRLFQRKDLVRYFFVRQSIDILTQTQIHKVIDNIRHLKKSFSGKIFLHMPKIFVSFPS